MPAGGAKISLKMNGQSVSHELKAGKSWDDFKTEKIGKISVSTAGDCEAILSATERRGVFVIHLESISFQPIWE